VFRDRFSAVYEERFASGSDEQRGVRLLHVDVIDAERLSGKTGSREAEDERERRC
jgi:hypothetical protein